MNSLVQENTHAAKLEEHLPYSHFIPLADIAFHVLQKAKEIELLTYRNYCTSFLRFVSKNNQASRVKV